MINKYSQKHQETLWKKAHVRYQTFSEEEKVKRRKKAWERYWHFTKKKRRTKTSILSGTGKQATFL